MQYTNYVRQNGYRCTLSVGDRVALFEKQVIDAGQPQTMRHCQSCRTTPNNENFEVSHYLQGSGWSRAEFGGFAMK
jgi:hypothetical protein